MTGSTESNGHAAVRAAVELRDVLAQVEQARADLVRLQQDTVVAERQLSTTQAAKLVEVNAKLLSATLRARSQAETARRDLEIAAASGGIDRLTGLPDHALTIDLVGRALTRASRHGAGVALLFLDIEQIEQLKATLGHKVAGEMLLSAARSLASNVRASDVVGRHGEHSFLIALDDVVEASQASLVADKLIAALAVPHHVGGQSMPLEASVGIGIGPADGDDAETFVERAATAVQEARRQGVASVVSLAVVAASEPLVRTSRGPSARRTMSEAEHQQRHSEQREANEQLVLAALSARDLQTTAELALQRQTEFLAVLAHELRNPLTPLRVATDLLGRAQDDATLLPRLQMIIDRQVLQMTRLVGDLLDVSRVSTGKMRLEHHRFDLGKALATAKDTCQPAIDVRRQTLRVQLPATPLEILGDQGRLVQVFCNLLDNASKYTGPGGELELSAIVAGGDAVVTVADNGIGIASEILPHVFEPFVQEAHATDFNGVGLGIGLTLVRELVEAHGGNVVATSAGSDMGSRFIVTLPLAAGDET